MIEIFNIIAMLVGYGALGMFSVLVAWGLAIQLKDK